MPINLRCVILEGIADAEVQLMELYELSEFWSLAEAFVQNIALFIVISFVLGRIYDRTRGKRGPRWHFAASCLFTFGALASMVVPYEPVPGVLLDQRNVILLFAGPFGGPWAAVIATLSTAGTRLYLGGTGAWAGFAAALSSGLLGLWFMNHFGRLQSLRSAALGAGLLGTVNYPWVLLFPGTSLGVELTVNFALPFAVFYFSAAPVLTSILMVHLRRVKADAELARSQMILEDVLDISTDWFWEIDADLRFTFLSHSFKRVFDRDPSTYIGKRRSELAPPETRAEVDAYETMLRQQRPFSNMLYPDIRPGRPDRYVSISGNPIFADDGTFMGYRGSGREVTDEVLAERKLKLALIEAEEANMAKSAFLSQMSHELRTPLNAVIGFSEMIAEQIRGPVDNPAYLEDAIHIRDSGKHLLSLINKLLDLSAIEAGKARLDFSECRPAEIVDWAGQMLQPHIEAGKVDWQVSDQAPGLRAILDEQAFRQIVLNLGGNAIKFTEPGGRVDVTLKQTDDDSVCLTVADTGSGIPAHELDTVFKPFERAEHARMIAAEGTGLGLTICKALVDAHGGHIELQSVEGEGTTVTVYLPLRPRQPASKIMAA